jgi:hypothetical protein
MVLFITTAVRTSEPTSQHLLEEGRTDYIPVRLHFGAGAYKTHATHLMLIESARKGLEIAL